MKLKAFHGISHKMASIVVSIACTAGALGASTIYAATEEQPKSDELLKLNDIQPAAAGALCKASEIFRPSLGTCVQVKTGLKWWTEGANKRLSHSEAKALCESQDMRLPASQELIALAKDGAISAFTVELDEIFWALEATADQSSHTAVDMSNPDKIAVKNDQNASFLCVSGISAEMEGDELVKLIEIWENKTSVTPLEEATFGLNLVSRTMTGYTVKRLEPNKRTPAYLQAVSIADKDDYKNGTVFFYPINTKKETHSKATFLLLSDKNLVLPSIYDAESQTTRSSVAEFDNDANEHCHAFQLFRLLMNANGRDVDLISAQVLYCSNSPTPMLVSMSYFYSYWSKNDRGDKTDSGWPTPHRYENQLNAPETKKEQK